MDEEEEREMREQQVALEQVSDRSERQCLRSGLKAYVVPRRARVPGTHSTAVSYWHVTVGVLAARRFEISHD